MWATGPGGGYANILIRTPSTWPTAVTHPGVLPLQLRSSGIAASWDLPFCVRKDIEDWKKPAINIFGVHGLLSLPCRYHVPLLEETSRIDVFEHLAALYGNFI
jgi:hypothetical protein